MISCAKSISEGGTALVFLANIMPGFLLKLSSPYWFDKVSYRRRIGVGSVLMGLSFSIVSLFSYMKDVGDSMSASASASSNSNSNSAQGGEGEEGVTFYVLMQLLGVAFCSAQGDLGEASLLALCGRVDSLLTTALDSNTDTDTSSGTNIDTSSGTNNNHNRHEEATEQKNKSMCITAFASGTGLAGPLGFAYVVFMTKVLLLSLPMALLLALIFPISFWTIFNKYLYQYTIIDDGTRTNMLHSTSTSVCGTDDDNDDEATAFLYQSSINNIQESIRTTEDTEGELALDRNNYRGHNNVTSSSLEISTTGMNYDCEEANPNNIQQNFISNTLKTLSSSTSTTTTTITTSATTKSSNSNNNHSNTTIRKMTFHQRLKLTLSLWPYMIPLFTVYASEYALQSGVWTAIGFPVDNQTARNSFYTNSNWAYQIGVFLSRSSGAFCIAPMFVLWLMPFLQVLNLIFFYAVAFYKFWYSYWLILPSFYVGLLGGSVYVHGYMRINKDLPVDKREFALSTVSVADSLGIVFADISGLFIQSCLYKSNDITGAVVSCPI